MNQKSGAAGGKLPPRGCSYPVDATTMAHGNPYDSFILDHIKNARNYRALDDADHTANGINPMCGDEMTVYLKTSQGVIDDVGFQCSCCGISMASASIMTETIKGKSLDDAKAALKVFITAINDRILPNANDGYAHLPAIFELTQELPARTRCAALAWVTLAAALEQRTQAICAP